MYWGAVLAVSQKSISSWNTFSEIVSLVALSASSKVDCKDVSRFFSSGSLRSFQSTHAPLWSRLWHRIGGMEQILTPSEPDKSLPLLAFFLFQSPLHLLSSRLICHYLFLSHSLSCPFCCSFSFHPLCVPVCHFLSPSHSLFSLQASQAVGTVRSGLLPFPAAREALTVSL